VNSTPNMPSDSIDAGQQAVSVIIPAYNEQDSLLHQIELIRQAIENGGFPYEIIVVDDGSVDRTFEVAVQSQVRVLRHPENRGYGASLKTGIRAARYEIISIIDADGTYPAEQIPIMLDKLAHADMVVGSRTGDEVNVPISRRPAKWMLQALATRIAGQKIPDLNSGMRLFRRECAMQYFPILSNQFSFTTTITLAYMADDYRVVYYPINYYARIGRSKIVPWHFVDFLVLILRISMIFNPLKIYLPLAITFGGLGVLKATYDILALFLRTPQAGWPLFLQPTLSTSAVLLIFTGLQFLMIGMVADGVIRRIAQHNRPAAPSFGNLSYDVVKSPNTSIPGEENRDPD
jgi:glycosyltransferase involved in cell wall biosynthesis